MKHLLNLTETRYNITNTFETTISRRQLVQWLGDWVKQSSCRALAGLVWLKCVWHVRSFQPSWEVNAMEDGKEKVKCLAQKCQKSEAIAPSILQLQQLLYSSLSTYLHLHSTYILNTYSIYSLFNNVFSFGNAWPHMATFIQHYNIVLITSNLARIYSNLHISENAVIISLKLHFLVYFCFG